MKILIGFFLASIATVSFAQTTDSISTPLGDFVVVTTEEISESTGYQEESSSTSDGGTAEFLTISAGSARMAAPASTSDEVLNVRMSPNPAEELVQLDISGASGSVTIAVTDLTGREVYYNVLVVAGSRIVYLPTQTWANGTFLVVFRSEGQQHTERLVVQ